MVRFGALILALVLVFQVVSSFSESEHFLKELQSLKDVRDEVIWALRRHITNFEKTSEISFESLKKTYKTHRLSEYKDDVYWIYMLPSEEHRSFRREMPLNYVRFLPTFLNVMDALGLTLEQRKNPKLVGYYSPVDHPVQDKHLCLDYAGFGTFGPYWPTVDIAAKSWSFTEPSPNIYPRNLNRTSTTLKYIVDPVPPLKETGLPHSMTFKQVDYLLRTLPLTSSPEVDRNYTNTHRHVVSYAVPIKEGYSRASYLVWGGRSIITTHGSVIFKNHDYNSRDGCWTRRPYRFADSLRSLKEFYKEHSATFDDLFPSSNPDPIKYEELSRALRTALDSRDTEQRPMHYDKVFFLTGTYSCNFYHFLIDDIPRIAFFRDFLAADPEIKVHLLETEEELYQKTKKMRRSILKYLGISEDRIVYGVITANQVFLPRYPRCYLVLSNHWSVQRSSVDLVTGVVNYLQENSHLLAGSALKNIQSLDDVYKITNPYFLAAFDGKDYFSSPMYYNQLSNSMALRQSNKQKHILVYHRSKTMNLVRGWPDTALERLVFALQLFFPDHQINVMSDADTTESTLDQTAKSVLEFGRADILITNHGAGEANSVFMKPGSLIVEVNADASELSFPVCGYYPNLSSVFGHHHLLYSFRQFLNPSNYFDFNFLAREILIYYEALRSKSIKEQIQAGVLVPEEHRAFAQQFDAAYPFLFYSLPDISYYTTWKLVSADIEEKTTYIPTKQKKKKSKVDKQ